MSWIVYCCMKAWLPTTKIQIQSVNLLGKLTRVQVKRCQLGFQQWKKSKFHGKKLQNWQKLICMWVRAEQKIRNQKRHSKSSGCGRQPFFPSLEKDIHDEFKTKRREGKVVKQWWFNTRMLQIVKVLHVEIVLKTKQPEAETSLVYDVLIRVIIKESASWTSDERKRHGINMWSVKMFYSLFVDSWNKGNKRRESRESRLQSIRSFVFRLLSKVWSSSSQENTHCPESPRAAEKHNNEIPFKDLARAKKRKLRWLWHCNHGPFVLDDHELWFNWSKGGLVLERLIRFR